MSPLPPTYKAASIPAVNEDFKIVELPMRNPLPDEVLIKVYASGICHTDHAMQNGALCWSFPRVPGHEVVGRVAAVGSNIRQSDPRAKIGALVGVGFIGGYCGFYCDSCREGVLAGCASAGITGGTYDGGHAEYMIAPFSAVLSIPEDALKTHTYAELAPLMCAGATMYEALRATRWDPGEILVIQGIGGLGHLGIQYGNKLGLKVVAVSSGASKEQFAKDLGAHIYIDASATDAVDAIRELGGARLIITTAPKAQAMVSLIPALKKAGTLVQVGADFSPEGNEMRVPNVYIVTNRLSLIGWTCGSSKDTENCMRFSAMTGIKPIVETFSLDQFCEAYDKVMHGNPRLRCVVTFD
ncbi:GroES-like protein [Exidia glandulosa HHB12029]|uniref:GroES-like protein n=1 Tax=Exidia glandulosa HHB12029 TaxID=1314781 RepID=A0A166BC79_EXIGL|nr:GroES-like protein [Exidia glandulosa HHB12029]